MPPDCPQRSPLDTATGTADAVNRREITAVEAVQAALARLDAVEPHLRAFHSVDRDRALTMAASIDRQIAAGWTFPLAGVPIGVKKWERPDSPQLKRLLAAGCVPIGSTTVPDRTTPWRTWGRNADGPTRNPWRSDRTPGGSSAGSAAAVAAGVVPLATGIDGAGSIRIPAAWCGIIGVKTTGRTGTLARTADDATRYLEVVLGRALDDRVPLRAAWSSTLGYATPDQDHVDTARAHAETIADLVDTDLALLDPTPAWLDDDHHVRAENDHRLAALFADVDLLMTPTTPGPPHGHHGPGERVNAELTWAFNVAGYPAASIPAGFTRAGLPIGLQIVARPHREAALIAAVRRGTPESGCGPLRA